MPRRISLLALVALVLAGCTAVDTQIERGRSLAGVQRFFVLASPHDSRGLEHRIVAALRARNLVAEAGPRTMMPDDTQAVVSYQERWAWDFGEHLMLLQLSVRDPKSNQSYANGTYAAKIPGRKNPAAIVDELVGRLLAGEKS